MPFSYAISNLISPVSVVISHLPPAVVLGTSILPVSELTINNDKLHDKTLLFMDMFDTIGTLVGVATKANMLDKDGKVPNIKKALLADAVGTTVGACLGTSTVSTFVESASGVAEGGRTGLTSITTGLMFLLALFFAPIFTSIPTQATAPVLILVGVMMASSLTKIDFSDFTNAIPAFLTFTMMPLAYSIADGIIFGIISFTILKLSTGKKKEVNMYLIVLSILFMLKFIFISH